MIICFHTPSDEMMGEAQDIAEIMLFFVMWFICYTYPYE